MALCSICQDYLTERPQVLRQAEDLIVCALACGHLFHRVCVTQWFTRQGAAAHGLQQGSCPCCKKNVNLNNALRIFPTGDEEGDRMVRQDKELKSLTAEIQKLRSDKEELRKQLERSRSSLEEEVVAHDILKMEYGQAASRLDGLLIELQDSKDMMLAVENSFKTALEKSESERKEALQKLTEKETQYNDSVNQTQSLKASMEKLKLEDTRRQQQNKYLQASLFSKDSMDLETFTNNNGGSSRLTTGPLGEGSIRNHSSRNVPEPELIIISDSSDESPVRSSTSTSPDARLSPTLGSQSVPASNLFTGFDAFFVPVSKGGSEDSDSSNSVG